MAAAITKTDTVVVGAGQAGVAMSEHLSNQGIAHVVLERHRIAESWRTARWDSLVANGPAWHDRFPNMEFADLDRDAFPSKDRVADYFESYARKFNAPVHTGVEVTQATRNVGRSGFTIETSAGTYDAQRIVVATGAFQKPTIPAIAPQTPQLTQLHSAHYRNPDQLPAGGVLVVGAGSSGAQIADELQRAGRQVYLSVGFHDRPVRSYRGLDSAWWQGVLGNWDQELMPAGREHVTIAVSGARGGHTVDFRDLANQGVTLVGQTRSFEAGVAHFEADLAKNLALGDASYLSLLQQADAYALDHGLDLPPEPQAHNILPDPACVTQPVTQLDLAAAGVHTILWATGFTRDYGWLQVDTFDAQGKPVHQRGVAKAPGVYFVGLPWLSSRGSAFIFGVWHDARHVAGVIAKQHRYGQYQQSSAALGA